MNQLPDNKPVTNDANSELAFKKKIEKFYQESKKCRSVGLCPVEDVLAPTADKWSLFIMYYLAYREKMRFNELKNTIRGISARMLSVNLKRLEQAGILNRAVFAEVPPRVEYSLSEFGLAYAKKLIDLNLWLIEKHPALKRT